MDFDRVLQGILDIGEEMVVCGAEVNRVEDSIYRMCESYGADRINVFIITSNIQVTMEAPDGRILTHIRRKFDEVMNRPKQHISLKFIGAILVSGGFTVFFGGSWLDCIAASIDGVVIVLMELFLASREKNQIVYNFVVSVVAGITALLLVQIGLGDHSDKIMIGGIMLLIPGIAMTNAIRDMLIGDIASGLLRLVNSILVAAAIACGFAFTIIVLGGVL